MKYTYLSLALGSLLALAACSEKPEATPAATPDTMAPAAPATSAAPATGEAPAAAEAAADVGKLKYGSVCAGCHGQQGQGMAAFPKLSGQTADVLAAKLHDYKAGKKRGEQTAIMAPTAQGLSDSDIDALSSYIASLPK
jgi:cytochrome c553